MNDKRASFHRPLRVRKVHSWRTFLWLSRGFSDFLNAPLVGLLHGLVMGVFGGLMLYMAWDRFWVLAGAFSSGGAAGVAQVRHRGVPILSLIHI